MDIQFIDEKSSLNCILLSIHINKAGKYELSILSLIVKIIKINY